MATRTFLNSSDFEKAQSLLLPPLEIPTAEMWEGQVFPSQDFSAWLAVNIDSQLRKCEHWLSAQPIAIGTWGRGELAPGSDLDVIFCGSEADVSQLLEELKEKDIELKYRFAKNKEDWSQDTNIFEINALFSGNPFTREAAAALQIQKQKILLKKKSFRRELLKQFEVERKKRNHRYDSITNYLEPQIKFGPGGLRDIQQALMIADWYGEILEPLKPIIHSLQQIKGYFLTVRQKLHLLGYGDVLVAQSQRELAQWFGYSTHADFMREMQKILFKVSFYCDLIFEICGRGKLFKPDVFKSGKAALLALKNDPSLSTQYSVMQQQKQKDFLYSSDFKKMMSMETSDATMSALFRTRTLSKIIPEFKKIEGVVQHDQYHRYTVDAHIRQAVRKVREFHNKPASLGKLRAITKNFKPLDWDILVWTALYHDMGKGREKDHSVEGKQIVEKDFDKLGLSKTLQTEVAWMVEQHLLLSTAAFRQDPQSPEVWRVLADKGAHGERLRRLAIFTAADIQATNPDAWTTWKERLLCGLVEAMEAPQGSRFLELKTEFVKHKISEDFLQKIDGGLLNSISAASLAKDLKRLLPTKKAKNTASIEFIKAKDGLWVRFFDPQDRDGLFLEYVTRLWQTGAVIHHAYVHTIDGFGVYDWFKIRTNLKRPVLQKMIAKDPQKINLKTAPKMLDVALVSESNVEWVVSFRGLDKKGVLLAAAACLHSLGLQIRWAKIHTWGRQIEDVFAISPTNNRSGLEWTQELKKRLVDS
ncbi:MAG: HD domain-containing protein [Bdellovibrionaceae bacterium]|nr:HD domain-containing protein [Pseudobdellovibrionaceae bacterium]